MLPHCFTLASGQVCLLFLTMYRAESVLGQASNLLGERSRAEDNEQGWVLADRLPLLLTLS